jgi:hypothetical protein
VPIDSIIDSVDENELKDIQKRTMVVYEKYEKRAIRVIAENYPELDKGSDEYQNLLSVVTAQIVEAILRQFNFQEGDINE